jgi:hypothetical protein
MILKIVGTTLTGTLRSSFSKRYPYLKLEFFRQGTNFNQTGSRKDLITEDVEINSIRESRSEGYLEFDQQITVEELESAFLNQFGLHVQVFRQSGKVWLETVTTDHLSLEQQNEMGKEHSITFKEESNIDFDYD